MRADRIRTIAFVTYPGLTLLDLVGPITTFLSLTRGLVLPSRHYRAVTVGQRVAPTDTDTPMAMIPEYRFDEVTDPFAIIVPGGGMAAVEVMRDDALVDYVRAAGRSAQIVGSVSTGTFLLAAAGVLDGRRVTTHPAYAELLQTRGANYVGGNWVEDGGLITAAGVSGGIDMALHLVARLQDQRAARDIQLVIEYDPHPPFGGLRGNGDTDGARPEPSPPGQRAQPLEPRAEPGAANHEPDLRAVKTIAFVLYPGLTLFDLAGPLQVLTAFTETAPEYRTVVVAERKAPTDTDLPGTMTVLPDATFADVPEPFAFVVPGGATPTLRAMRNPAIRSYVRRAADTAEVVGSVCTGALILASVGLLKGRQATTHWAFSSVLEQLGARYVRRRWVEDGKFICSAGVSAGIDMALQLVARLTDERHARDVQYRLGYDPEPPFGGIDYEHIGGRLGAWRSGVRLVAPVIAAKPRRMTKQGR